MDWPKYVWVTEFGTGKGWSEPNVSDRRIYAHTVIDATSYEHSEPFVFFHFPGFVWSWQHNDKDEAGPIIESMLPVDDDRTYYPKIRGIDDFNNLGQ
jgi:hypothetical protein